VDNEGLSVSSLTLRKGILILLILIATGSSFVPIISETSMNYCYVKKKIRRKKKKDREEKKENDTLAESSVLLCTTLAVR